MSSKHRSPKKEPKNEPDESIPEPQPPRIPNASFYRSVVGPKEARSVVYDLPKNGDISYPPIKRKGNENSQWDPRLWPSLNRDNCKKENKKKSKEIFMLNDNEMADLPYILEERWGPNGLFRGHMYLYVEVQRRAWEVYGGPEGFRLAKRRHGKAAKAEKSQQSPNSTHRSTAPSPVAVSPRFAPYPNSSPVRPSNSAPRWGRTI